MEPLDGGIRGRSRPLAGDISPGEGAEILPVNFKTKEPPRKICGSSPEFVYKLSHPPPPQNGQQWKSALFTIFPYHFTFFCFPLVLEGPARWR